MVEQEEAKARLGLTRHREQLDSPGNVSEVSTGASLGGGACFVVCLWAPLHAIGEQAWASGPSRPGPTGTGPSLAPRAPLAPGIRCAVIGRPAGRAGLAAR